MNPIKKNHDAMLRTGAMALAAAGASTAAHAATVQITFNNSFISTTEGNHLVTDFGGDGVGDIRGFFHATVAVVYGRGGDMLGFGGALGNIGRAGVGVLRFQAPVAVLADLVGLSLRDTSVRGGVATSGWLDVAVTGRPGGEKGRVEVSRFIFDDASGVAPTGVSHASAAYPEYVAAVPEPSGLGLLALGAGGLLARRRRAMAA